MRVQLQGNCADAISCYNEVLRIDPMAADALVNRGNTYKEIGRVNEAIQDYVHAVSIRPTMAEAHANLASAYKDRCSSSVVYSVLYLCIFSIPNSVANTSLRISTEILAYGIGSEK